MARRRKRFRRVKPDMGWFVGDSVVQFTVANPGGGTSGQVKEVFMTFDDINSDPALITQDKSDWFIKRVIMDVYPVLNRGANSLSAPARLYEFAVGTMEDANSFLNAGDGVIDTDTYEQWRRLFKTYTRPVYATSQEFHDAGNLCVSDPGTPSSINTPDSPWGPSSIQDDFTVSNAGLVENSSMVFLASMSDSVSPSYHWAVDETLILGVTTRVLLQKRRT